MTNLIIFGAKSIALGVCIAIRQLHKDISIVGFIVSKSTGNPKQLAGLPVYDIANFPYDKETYVLIATPGNTHSEIINILEKNGFHNYICLKSDMEASLMEKYYSDRAIFQSLHKL